MGVYDESKYEINEDLEEALAQAPADVNPCTPLPRGLGLQQSSL